MNAGGDMAATALMSNPSIPAGAPFSEEMRRAIELELEAICNDLQFRTSQRNCAFLRYVICETLAGRADEIKERTLGNELFGRPISYDTGSDAVVRVRANELRKRLICYYETHRSQAGLRLHLPLRTYVPEFVREDALQAQPESVAQKEKAPIAVAVPVEQVEPARAIPITSPLLPSIHAEFKDTAPEMVVEGDATEPWWENHQPIMPVSRMMIPTLIALFLCVGTFRWQASYGTPYLDFWETLLSSRTGIAMVLDADPADSRAVMTSDVQMIAPLLQTAAHFHRLAQIASSTPSSANRSELLTVHITHRSPAGADSSAAYVTVVPGNKAQLWVDSEDAGRLNLAIRSIADTDLFPAALEMAARRNTPTRYRLAENEQVTAQTLPFSPQPESSQW
jgi:hypothetical protein